MKALILAAGRGSRLAPLTDDRPKCLVEYRGKPLVTYILDALLANDIQSIGIVSGYLPQVLETALSAYDIEHFHNAQYASTNMVTSLFTAERFLTDDILISYSDIIYSKSTVKTLLDESADIAIGVDKEWRELWERRMEDPLSDAETLKHDEQQNITELGLPPKSFDDIHGQYMGLIRIKGSILSDVVRFYHSLDRSALYRGADFDNMYMTTFLQLLIDGGFPVKASFISEEWLEVDEASDLEVDITLDV